jgi:hypothetical protein
LAIASSALQLTERILGISLFLTERVTDMVQELWDVNFRIGYHFSAFPDL